MAYKIYASFGGKLLGRAKTLKSARSKASKVGEPVDIWIDKGGHFGKGKVVAHVSRVAKNPSLPRGKWVRGKVKVTRGGKIQFKRT